MRRNNRAATANIDRAAETQPDDIGAVESGAPLRLSFNMPCTVRSQSRGPLWRKAQGSHHAQGVFPMTNRIALALGAATLSLGLALAPAAFAQDKMGKDGMAKDTMSKDTMSKDGMKKDGMAKDGMAKDGMAKDGMAKDGMKK
jgi:pentapeptide MXKDX repeat protein